MKTPIIDRDLTKQAPHSPREHIAGFAIAGQGVRHSANLAVENIPVNFGN